MRAVDYKSLWQFDYIYLIGLLLLFAPLYYYLFSIRMFYPQADGLYSGGNSWNDMSLHLAVSSSFLHGKNFPPVADIKKIYSGDVQSMELLKQYGVDYIYVSHSELEPFKPNLDYLNNNFQVVYRNLDITIYAVQTN